MTSTIYDIPANRIDGTPSSLGDFKGHVVLVVNVASACGLTPQYEALEKLYEAQRERGLVVAAFPCNDFGAQEPGSSEEIVAFCSTKFDVKFPMFEKVVVSGEEKHPLYKALIDAQPKAQKHDDTFHDRLVKFGITPAPAPAIMWNFEKFLVGRDGTVVARFAPELTPDDPIVLAAIEKELEKSA